MDVNGTNVSLFIQKAEDKNNIEIKAKMVALLRTFRHLNHLLWNRKIAGGSTACVVIVDRKDKLIYCANSGDSRAMLKNDDERTPVRLSYDHKPNDKIEQKRIEQHGEYVSVVPGSVPRVNGMIATSRAIGGHNTEVQQCKGITWHPHISVHRLQQDSSVMVMGSDGLFDVIKDATAGSFACAAYKEVVEDGGSSSSSNGGVGGGVEGEDILLVPVVGGEEFATVAVTVGDDDNAAVVVVVVEWW
jgi:serine/threonine protein phosphatase PrpC